MSDDSDRLWPYAEIDTLVISLWPLVMRYNWTYRDLLNVLRSLNPQPPATNPFHRYPCDREQDLAAYCITALGLRKTGKGIQREKWPTRPATRSRNNYSPPWNREHRACKSRNN